MAKNIWFTKKQLDFGPVKPFETGTFESFYVENKGTEDLSLTIKTPENFICKDETNFYIGSDTTSEIISLEFQENTRLEGAGLLTSLNRVICNYELFDAVFYVNNAGTGLYCYINGAGYLNQLIFDDSLAITHLKAKALNDNTIICAATINNDYTYLIVCRNIADPLNFEFGLTKIDGVSYSIIRDLERIDNNRFWFLWSDDEGAGDVTIIEYYSLNGLQVTYIDGNRLTTGFTDLVRRTDSMLVASNYSAGTITYAIIINYVTLAMYIPTAETVNNFYSASLRDGKSILFNLTAGGILQYKIVENAIPAFNSLLFDVSAYAVCLNSELNKLAVLYCDNLNSKSYLNIYDASTSSLILEKQKELSYIQYSDLTIFWYSENFIIAAYNDIIAGEGTRTLYSINDKLRIDVQFNPLSMACQDNILNIKSDASKFNDYNIILNITANIEAVQDYSKHFNDRLLFQYRNAVVFKDILSLMLAKEGENIQTALIALLDRLNIDYISGSNLDIVGLIIHENRSGQSDDAYRIAIKQRIAANSSTGTTADIYQFLSIMSPNRSALIELYPAAIECYIENKFTIKQSFLDSLSAGVAFYCFHIFRESGVYFGWTDDPEAVGFGDTTDPSIGGLFDTIYVF